MKIRVLYFALLRDALSNTKRLRAAVSQDMAEPDTVLKAGDEVAFFPPVTGG